MNVKKVRLRSNYVLVTNNVYTAKDFEGKLQAKMDGALKEFQKVVAVGPVVKDIEVGDIVCINPARYAEVKYKENSIKNDIDGLMTPTVRYHFNMVEMNHQNYILLTDQDIFYVVEDFDPEEEIQNNLILPRQEIIA